LDGRRHLRPLRPAPSRYAQRSHGCLLPDGFEGAQSSPGTQIAADAEVGELVLLGDGCIVGAKGRSPAPAFLATPATIGEGRPRLDATIRCPARSAPRAADADAHRAPAIEGSTWASSPIVQASPKTLGR